MAVERTFLYDVVGNVHLAVHDDVAPHDAEWQLYLDDIEAHLGEIDSLLIHTTGGGPSATQRRSTTDHWKQIGATPNMAIMTSSKIVRGMVGTLAWFLGNEVRAFALDDFEGAGAHLGLQPDLVVRIGLRCEELRASL